MDWVWDIMDGLITGKSKVVTDDQLPLELQAFKHIYIIR
jgi:hypothetical protein